MNKDDTISSIQKQRLMSFFTFISDNYELSKFILPKTKPKDDSLNHDEAVMLIELMNEKDFYEINTIIRKKYYEK